LSRHDKAFEPTRQLAARETRRVDACSVQQAKRAVELIPMPGNVSGRQGFVPKYEIRDPKEASATTASAPPTPGLPRTGSWAAGVPLLLEASPNVPCDAAAGPASTASSHGSAPPLSRDAPSAALPPATPADASGDAPLSLWRCVAVVAGLVARVLLEPLLGLILSAEASAKERIERQFIAQTPPLTLADLGLTAGDEVRASG
jgi:hypothetical protein